MSSNDASPQGELLTESLRVLVAAHYLLAFVTLLATPLGLYLAYVGWGLLHPARGEAWIPRPGQEFFDPLLWGAVFFQGGGILATLCLMHTGLLAYVGRCIAGRRRRRFCLIFSIFDLTYVPLGTVLGVFALLLLLKPQAKQEFK